jgi:molybdopterin/thiamine biosynthesis adenylyltransferase
LAEKISSARVTIGGMGGLGWLVGGALSGLGVRNMQVFDPDHLEVENLNRLWGCQSTDLKQAKVDLFQQRAQGIDSGISVVGHQQAIPCKNFEQALIDSDVVFGCYDRPEPRLATQVLALKSNALYIDAGVAIKSKENGFLGFGQVFVSESIDVPCIVCAGLTQDTMGYRGDGQAPEPSSGVLNGVLANLAVSVWLQHLQGNDMSSMYSFDWNAMSLDKSKNIQKRPTCPICGPAPDWKDQV